MEQLKQQIENLSIAGETHLTGVVYDPDTLLHKSTSLHVEGPNRVASILDQFETSGLFKHSNVERVASIPLAQREHIAAVHPPEYMYFVDNVWPSEKQPKKKEIWFSDTYANEHSTRAAYLAAGGSLLAIDKIVQRNWQNSFVIVRPPGHHSGHSEVCTGFCFFNNVVIAAKYAQQKHSLRRIAIVDWDVHHGDGTYSLISGESEILFVSLHRYDNGFFYPGKSGNPQNIGKGAGIGSKINIAWNTDTYEDNAPGDDEYIYAFERIVIPVLREFVPDLILVSCGFDAARDDPLGGCSIGPDGYAYLTTRLQQVQPRVVVCLEGGYNLSSIQSGAESVLRSLLGEKMPLANSESQRTLKQMRRGCTPNLVSVLAVEETLKHISEHWKCLRVSSTNADDEKDKRINKLLALDKTVEQKSKNMVLLGAKNWLVDSASGLIEWKTVDIQHVRFYEKAVSDSFLKTHSLQFVQGAERDKGTHIVSFKNPFESKYSLLQLDFYLASRLMRSSGKKLKALKNSDNEGKKQEKSSPPSAIKGLWTTGGFRISAILIRDEIGRTARKNTRLMLKTMRETQQICSRFITSKNLQNVQAFLQESSEYFAARNQVQQHLTPRLVLCVNLLEPNDTFCLWTKLHNLLGEQEHEKASHSKNLPLPDSIQKFSQFIIDIQKK